MAAVVGGLSTNDRGGVWPAEAGAAHSTLHAICITLRRVCPLMGLGRYPATWAMRLAGAEAADRAVLLRVRLVTPYRAF